MGSLEKVLQMKKEGLTEGEIIARLKGQGVSPMEINDALNQSKIKEAIGVSNPTEGMVPSIMGSEENETNPGKRFSEPNPQREAVPQDIYSPQPSYDQYMPQPQMPYQVAMPGEQYEEEAYPAEGNEGGEYTGYGSPADTMIEIAEQVFAEKIKKLEKQLRDMLEFKTIYSTRIDDINERVKRMEKYFDKMQLNIIEKVGNYGKELDSIRKEMEMVEDSFSKMLKK